MIKTTFKISMDFFEKDYSIKNDKYMKDRNKQWIPLKEHQDRVKALKEDVETIFSEGFLNYFHTTYGSDDEQFNEDMIMEIDKKILKLMQSIDKHLKLK